MTCRRPPLVGTFQRLFKEWWIADNGIKLPSKIKAGEVSFLKAYSVRPRTRRRILPCLFHTVRIDVNAPKVCLWHPLRHHQRYQSAPAPHIKHLPRTHCRPCTQQNTIGAHFLCAPMVFYQKLLESKRHLNSLHSTLYSLHSTLYSLHSTLYTLHSTLYTLFSILYSPPPPSAWYSAMVY